MRKRTIFRSSSIAALGLAAFAAVSTLRAQEPAPAQATPQVHVVVEGETLWDLAARYLGDPFLWPEIYRLNRTVVEDPHWIFPGEELHLGPGGAVMAGQPQAGVAVEPGLEPVVRPVPGQELPEQQVAPDQMQAPVAPPPPPTATGPTIFVRHGGEVGVTGDMGVTERAARPYEFYSSGFLTEGQALPFAAVGGAIDRPKLARVSESSFAGMFDHIRVIPPAGAVYQAGDSLLLGALLRKVTSWGEIFYPSGIARVTEVGADGVVAQVVAQYNRITDGQVALPLEAFPDPGQVMPVPVENGMMGSIVEPRQLNPVPSQQQVVFIDLGRNAGVKVGDVFTVLKASEEAGVAPTRVAYARIVHVRDQSATGLLINIMGLGIEAGAPVQLLEKMPS
jgi:hypothetical protein